MSAIGAIAQKQHPGTAPPQLLQQLELTAMMLPQGLSHPEDINVVSEPSALTGH